MKIWIDFINTPQVSFWIPFIIRLKENGHELLLTCRESGNTVELLKQNNLKFHIVGKKVGTGIFQKITFFTQRLQDLNSFIKKTKPDIAVSQSSFYQPIIARFWKIPVLYTNDNEHATGNIPAFLFADKVFLPETLKEEKFTKKWPLKNKLTFYPGVKEAIYLSQNKEIAAGKQKRNKIYFRPEPWSAQYYKGPLNFFDNVLFQLSNKYDVIVLPRDKSQVEHYKKSESGSLIIAEKPLPLKFVLENCMLFIGAGGSMTRELAILGVPVISIYQDSLLSVDKYIINRGLMKVIPNISYRKMEKEINLQTTKKIDLEILNKGKEAFELIYNEITKLNKSLC